MGEGGRGEREREKERERERLTCDLLCASCSNLLNTITCSQANSCIWATVCEREGTRMCKCKYMTAFVTNRVASDDCLTKKTKGFSVPDSTTDVDEVGFMTE